MHNKYVLHVISHAHWDREWYQTFQSFRKRLVFMMDELIEHMEVDHSYKYFHMDGQTIPLEDYLEIRPENEQRLRALIKAGRIIIGPWYVMPDEFLISGESLIRNLQKGFGISRSYGVEPMKCGYVTDIFGHNSQLPQILRGFGIESALLYRGIADYPKDAFTWVGADGSTVLAIKLDRERSYSNFYFAVRWPFEGREYDRDELVARMKELFEFSRGLAVSGNLLMMDGVDHGEIEPRLPELLDVFNESIEEIDIRHSTMEDFIKEQRNSGAVFDEIKGELYNPGIKGVNNQVLKNVLSSMVHLKQANNECEVLLTKWAEPFEVAAGFVRPQKSRGFLEEAWKLLMQNHPHDSICGCSITQVHRDNEYRFNQVRDIACDMVEMELGELASAADTRVTGKENNIVLFNAGQGDYKGVVQAEIEFPAGSQWNFKIFDNRGKEVPYQLLNVRKSTWKRIVRFRRLVDFQARDLYTVAFEAWVPAVGYNVYGYEEYRNSPIAAGDYTYKEFHAPTRYLGTMQTGHRTWENEYIKVRIENNGTFTVMNKATGKEYADLLMFEDCADTGDGWNYRKPLKDSRYLSLGGRFDFSIEYDGPLGIRWKITHYMNLPEKMSQNGVERADTLQELKITTLVDLYKGSSRLEFRTYLDNSAGEHRLRVLFPSFISADTFFTSTPFFLQERNIRKPDWSSHVEPETGVYPNQGIILLKDTSDCLAVFNKGLYEVEVTEDESRTIALTLFRSFKNEVGRDMGEMSFLYRKLSFEYALEFNPGSVGNGAVMVSGESWRAGIKAVFAGSHKGTLPGAASFLGVDIPGAVLSAFKDGRGGLKVVRLYNCTNEAASGEITMYKVPERVLLLDLNEEVLQETGFQGNKVRVEMEPGRIVTLGIEFK